MQIADHHTSAFLTALADSNCEKDDFPLCSVSTEDPMVKCILFDVDDTLVASDVLRVSALAACGHPSADSIPTDALRFSSPPQLMSDHGGLSMPAYWTAYKEAILEKASPAVSDLPPVLRRLQQEGIAMGIVTSSRREIAEMVLGELGFGEFFEGCSVGYGDCTRRKPHPDPIFRALRILDLNPDDAIYVGDGVRDLQASRGAGVAFGYAAWAGQSDELDAGADYVFSTASDMLQLI